MDMFRLLVLQKESLCLVVYWSWGPPISSLSDFRVFNRIILCGARRIILFEKSCSACQKVRLIPAEIQTTNVIIYSNHIIIYVFSWKSIVNFNGHEKYYYYVDSLFHQKISLLFHGILIWYFLFPNYSSFVTFILDSVMIQTFTIY